MFLFGNWQMKNIPKERYEPLSFKLNLLVKEVNLFKEVGDGSYLGILEEDPDTAQFVSVKENEYCWAGSGGQSKLTISKEDMTFNSLLPIDKPL